MKILIGFFFVVLLSLCQIVESSKEYHLYPIENTPFPVKACAFHVSVGTTIYLVGQTSINPKFVNITFQDEFANNPSTFLHFSNQITKDFHQKLVVSNYQNETQLDEIRVGTPFMPNKPFDFRIYIQNKTHVSVFGNRQMIGDFKMYNNFDINTIRCVKIEGDLAKFNNAIYNHLPHKDTNDYGFYDIMLKPNKMIRLSGIPNGDEFKIRFSDTSRQIRTLHETIAFELKVNFKEKYIGRNAWIDGSWGVEERHGGFPIKLNELLDIAIVNEDAKSLHIYLNGKKYATFQNRFEDLLMDIDHMEVSEGIELLSRLNFDAVERK